PPSRHAVRARGIQSDAPKDAGTASRPRTRCVPSTLARERTSSNVSGRGRSPTRAVGNNTKNDGAWGAVKPARSSPCVFLHKPRCASASPPAELLVDQEERTVERHVEAVLVDVEVLETGLVDRGRERESEPPLAPEPLEGIEVGGLRAGRRTQAL